MAVSAWAGFGIDEADDCVVACPSAQTANTPEQNTNDMDRQVGENQDVCVPQPGTGFRFVVLDKPAEPTDYLHTMN